MCQNTHPLFINFIIAPPTLNHLSQTKIVKCSISFSTKNASWKINERRGASFVGLLFF